ncbi:MAG TPA: hypothetical protein VI670_00340 [Thermoanaerobaculia bacterium]|jgi:hypothetical protein
MPRLRAILAVAAFAAIAAGAFQPLYVRMLFADARPMHAAFDELPYRRLPGLRRLMLDVARMTPPGARIALYAPFNEWDGGYGYAFRRAPFLLAGRRVLPMLEPGRDRPTARYLGEAEYVVCWRGCPPLNGFRRSWGSADGELLVRAR